MYPALTEQSAIFLLKRTKNDPCVHFAGLSLKTAWKTESETRETLPSSSLGMSGIVINSFSFPEILGTAQRPGTAGRQSCSLRHHQPVPPQPPNQLLHCVEHKTGTSTPEHLQPLIILQSPLLHQTQPSWLPTSVSDAEQQGLLLTEKGGTPPLKIHLPTASEISSH